MDWDKLKAFYHVAKYRNISKAANHMNLSQSAISRQIMALEDRLRVRLFTRSLKGLSITEEGKILLETTHLVFSQIEATQLLIKERNKDPQGKLRISTTVFFAAVWFTDYLESFLKKYLKIKLETIATDEEPDFNSGEVDAAIRPKMSKSKGLIQEKLIEWDWSLYASKSYLEEYGTPKSPQDLDEHRFIAFGNLLNQPFSSINWHLNLGMPKGVYRDPYISINSTHATCAAAIKGLGIATLSEVHVASLGTNDLVPILPDHKGPVIDCYYIYPEILKDSPKIKALRIELKKSIEQMYS